MRKKRPLLPLLLLAVVLAVVLRMDWSGYLPAAETESPPQNTAEMLVWFFDVGQGDSELIQVPTESGSFNMLIDTGESERGDSLLAYLEHLGVTKLDALVMTHPHADHIGAMGRVIETLEVGRLYMPVVPEEYTPTTAAYERVLDALEKTGVPVTRLVTGVQIEAPDTIRIQVLAPEADADWEELNNYSAVLRVTVGDTAFLFAGDAEKESEAVMLANGSELSAQVLKVGHHGSATSTSEEFLRTVAPSYAVISCGKDNDYGHPHGATLDLLAAHGVTVLRTDESGTVLAATDGKTVVFEKDNL